MESIPFEIAHCSSFEPDYEPHHLILVSPAADNSQQDPFQNVSHRGWQTKRFPDYPQDLILQFKSGLCRISRIQILSHHYKIASQIELYIGITKEQEQDSMYIQFTRLGFVSLDNNNRFQDRELKSIKIQADCEYLRLVIKGCHENRLNVHKQVGLLALNILGHSIINEIQQDDSSASVEEDHYALLNNEQQQRTAALVHNTNVDFNLEHWIQVIQNAEEESAQDEDFKEAKIYKELGDRLTGLWRFLINLENDKQQAVATKDYDEADKIKADMIQVRENAELLLKQSGIQITRDGDILPYEDIPYTTSSDDEEEEDIVEEENQQLAENIIPDIQSIKETTPESKLNHQSSTSAHPDQLLDEAIANWTSFDALSINNNYKNSNSAEVAVSSPSLLSARIPINAESSSPSPPAAVVVAAEKKQTPEDPELIPEPLSTDDLESCELSIEVFGQDLVACIMSVKVKCRQKGLKQLLELIKQQQTLMDMEFVHASILMIQEAVTDSRESIFNQAIQNWKELHELILNNKDDNVTFGWIEKLFSRILIRTSDNSPGIKSTATKTALDLIDTYPALIPLCMKERMIRNMKDAKARVELVTLVTKKALIPQWKKDDATFYRKDVLTFISTYVKKHPHADVRQTTWDLLVMVAQEQDIKIVSTFLEADTLKALQQELKKTEKKRLIKSSTSTTVNELRALAVKSNHSNTIKKPKQHDDRKKTTAANSGNTTAASSKKNTKPVAAEKIQQEVIIEEEEEEEEKTNVCIFCDEEDPDFNEDTLISHYYNDCPVLTNCPMCQIILEVSTLKDHLKSDCERKHLVKQCTNCKEYIPIEQWLQHSKKKACVATAKHQSRCPFCQKEMTRSTEAGWKTHLLHQCPKNPRMLPAAAVAAK